MWLGIVPICCTRGTSSEGYLKEEVLKEKQEAILIRYLQRNPP